MLITIGHTYGSGGLEIGRRLAARLEIPCGDAEADEGARPLTGGTRLLRGGGPVRRPCSVRPAGAEQDFYPLRHGTAGGAADARARPVPGGGRREALRQDRERARLYGLHTGAKWGEVGRYDLTVDSGPLGVSGTVELLSQFIALKTMRRRSKEAAHAGTTD